MQHSPNPTPPPPSSQYQQSVENKGTAARTAYKTQPGGLNDRSAPAQDSANCPVGTSAAAASANVRSLDQANRTEDRNQQQQRQQQTAAAATGQPPVGHPLNAQVDGDTIPGPDEEEDEDEERILTEIEMGVLDVFGDVYMNKHLMYSIIELILVRLMPELSERGVTDLLEERLS